MVAVKDIARALEKVIDPELGIDVVSLGLIYGIEVEPGKVVVKMTTTTEHCPMGMALLEGVGVTVDQLEPGLEVEVWPVTEPRWSVDMMTDDARRWLGLPPRASDQGM